ncbi:hypothetical protein N9917_05105, partial [Deltaproteobacteria bacterium]|nr:hypothetical protein [Deltaproteobacteria bacterium]
MSDRILRNQLIRTAALMPKGSDERRHLLHLLASEEGPANPATKVAIKEETSQFADWVMLNLDPWSERAMETYLEKLLKRGPSAYVKAAPRRKPPMLVGDMVMPKPEKAPPQNEDVAQAFKYQPGTVEKVDGEGVLVKFESGQTAR